MPLYLIKDGIETAKIIDKHGNRIFNTEYYSISYDFVRNEGYIEKKDDNKWKLYTQIGQRFGQSRYFYFESFEKCINQLNNLNENKEIIILSQKELIQQINRGD